MADDLTTRIIKEREGFRATPYWDVNAWRVGYGSDTMTEEDGTVVPVTKASRTTRAAADRDLARRIPEFQAQGVIPFVGQDAWDKLAEGARAAITSVAYNYGSLEELPSLTKAARTGDAEKIAAAIEKRAGDNDSINADRRRYEASIVRGHPSPPASIGIDEGTRSAGSAFRTPTPLPRPRPQLPEAEITRASFNPLPFPGRLKTPGAPDAAYSLMPPPIPPNAIMPPRASRWKEEGGEWQTGQVLPPAVARPASLQQMPPQAPAPLPLLPFPALPRPGVGMGAVAGVGGMGAGAGGVVPPGPVPPRVPPAIPRLAATPPRYVPAAPPRERAAPPMPMGLPSFRRPVEAATPAPGGPPPIPSGGFDLGAMFAGLGETIGAKAQEAGAALGNATTSTFEGAKNAVATTAGNATDLLKNELIGTVAGRTLLLNTLMGNKGTIQTNPGKYGATPEARREAAARRQALQEGRPYIAPKQQTAVRSSLSVRPPSFKPPQSRAERFTNLDPFGMIL